ncbi:MAG: hypothetical protein E6R13_04660 [Spirochaetes bacterium]|nr:MAG: hypothetical protein E6R13_04660 [Spirochaetota bacterium]
MTKSTSFIKQILEIPHGQAKNNGYIDAYIGYYPESRDEWGDNIYLAFKLDQISSDYRRFLMDHKDFMTVYLNEQDLVFKFSISDDFKVQVMDPFKNGQYSKIDRNYVKTYFSQYVTDRSQRIKTSMNWQILTKDDELKKYWEKRIGVTFTEDMEVWSRPEKEEEIYGYQSSDNEPSPEDCEISNPRYTE